ncbi:MAG: hypothetical protein VX747_12570, partial [Actinomycetota bacterium]|nr:hypothetical protein [Actinomycetota bacterium]
MALLASAALFTTGPLTGLGEGAPTDRRALQAEGECYTADEASGIAVRAVDAVSQSVASLATALGDKADASTAAALQAAQAQLEEVVAVLTASLGGKANLTDVDALSEQMEGLSLSLESKAEEEDVVALTGTVSQNAADMSLALAEKVDGSVLQAALQLKANKSDVLVLTGTVSQHSAALRLKAEEADVLAQLSLKANSSTVDAMMQMLGAASEQIASGEPITIGMVITAVTPLLDAKADESATAAALAGKANHADVTALRDVVASKAESADVTALQDVVAGKADGADLSALTGTVAQNAAGVTALTEAMAGKADAVDLSSVFEILGV